MSALKKILVVDDDPIIGKSFDRVLSRKGYLVINAADGADALSKLANDDYDAVFTDIRMPGMSGLEVAERVRASRPWTPVVIITGHGTDAAEARAKAAGVSAFLRKPLSPDMIASSAEAAMEAATPMAVAEPMTAAIPVAREETPEPAMPVWKTLGLMIAAPVAALGFVLLFPLVGLAALAWTGFKALRVRHAAALAAGRMPNRALVVATNLVLFFASPFVALAYVAMFPFVGGAMLARTAVEAWRK